MKCSHDFAGHAGAGHIIHNPLRRFHFLLVLARSGGSHNNLSRSRSFQYSSLIAATVPTFQFLFPSSPGSPPDARLSRVIDCLLLRSIGSHPAWATVTLLPLVRVARSSAVLTLQIAEALTTDILTYAASSTSACLAIMAFCSRQYTAGSPVVAIKPRPSHQSHSSATNLTHEQSLSLALGVSAGKKRPYDEAGHYLDGGTRMPTDDKVGVSWVGAQNTAPSEPNAEDIADARSHSGKKREDECAPQQRPDLRSSKSQRMDLSVQQRSSPNPSNGARPGRLGQGDATAVTSKELVIDNLTLHLGIGWRSLSDDQSMQAAARGWARFIENHFALTSVRMCVESRGLQSYLVEASEGYFLFAENLRWGRLVSQTVEGALRNLQSSPPSFDGAETLTIEAKDHCQFDELIADTEMKTD